MLNSGGNAQTDADWYLEGARQFLEAVEDARLKTERASPLVGMPFIGSGAGGKTYAQGGLLTTLLHGLAELVRNFRSDVAFVVFNDHALAAAQAGRRGQLARFWPEVDSRRVDIARGLAALANDSGLVLFVGAGIGKGAGLPLWAELLDELAIESGIDPALIEGVGALDRARLIELHLEHSQLGSLRDLVCRRFGSVRRYSLAHALVAGLPVNEIVTTNYDELFERAAADAGREVAVLPYQTVRGRQRWLLKMHGCVTNPRDIVLTREDYLRYPMHRGALEGIVQALLITKHMLFVGFSLGDDNFHRVADDVRRAIGAGASLPHPFGTALFLERQRSLEALWRGELLCETVGAEGDDALAAGRQLDILLDLLLAESTTSFAHVMDGAFRDALTSEEQALALSLEEFANRVPVAARRAPEWRHVERFLVDLGWSSGEPSRTRR